MGEDGKTAYERTKGKAATVLGIEFGEKISWKRKAGQKMDKISSRWDFRGGSAQEWRILGGGQRQDPQSKISEEDCRTGSLDSRQCGVG